jgi:hypothetical protein
MIVREPQEQTKQEPERTRPETAGPAAEQPSAEREPAGQDVLPAAGERTVPQPRSPEPRTPAPPQRGFGVPRTLPDASSFADEVLSLQREQEEAIGAPARPAADVPAPLPCPEPGRQRTSPETPAAPEPRGEGADDREMRAERGRDGTAPLPSAPGGEGAFFERDEFPSETAVPAAAAVDAEAVEKARRFARIIVSDIALYNQEAVSEGIREGTFYELLQDDIAEGRSVYEKRVSEAIRATGDYLQEAFDNFIASKKKLR